MHDVDVVESQPDFNPTAPQLGNIEMNIIVAPPSYEEAIDSSSYRNEQKSFLKNCSGAENIFEKYHKNV